MSTNKLLILSEAEVRAVLSYEELIPAGAYGLFRRSRSPALAHGDVRCFLLGAGSQSCRPFMATLWVHRWSPSILVTQVLGSTRTLL
jgi:hypothetical protein